MRKKARFERRSGGDCQGFCFCQDGWWIGAPRGLQAGAGAAAPRSSGALPGGSPCLRPPTCEALWSNVPSTNTRRYSSGSSSAANRSSGSPCSNGTAVAQQWGQHGCTGAAQLAGTQGMRRSAGLAGADAGAARAACARQPRRLVGTGCAPCLQHRPNDACTPHPHLPSPPVPPASWPPAALAAHASTPAGPTATCPGRRPDRRAPAGTCRTTGCARCLRGEGQAAQRGSAGASGTSVECARPAPRCPLVRQASAMLLPWHQALLLYRPHGLPALEVPRGAGPGRATASAAKLRRPAAAACCRPAAATAAAGLEPA